MAPKTQAKIAMQATGTGHVTKVTNLLAKSLKLPTVLTILSLGRLGFAHDEEHTN